MINTKLQGSENILLLSEIGWTRSEWIIQFTLLFIGYKFINVKSLKWPVGLYKKCEDIGVVGHYSV